MNQNKFDRLAYLIGVTIIITIVIQIYWNVQNYEINKQRLVNEVQISLDNGIEAYFAELAKTDIMAFVNVPDSSISLKQSTNDMFSSFMDKSVDSIFLGLQLDSFATGKKPFALTQLIDSSSGITIDTLGNLKSVSVYRGQTADSIRNLQGLANKIIISITRDTIDFQKLDNYFNKELYRKQIDIRYAFTHTTGDSTFKWQTNADRELPLTTFSKSTYLPSNETLQLRFSNPTLAVLKRSLTGILLSIVLCALIIGSLFFLLHIIKKQKQLAEIKNDLISNITHEFKTPIATVSTAIEGIKNFNDANDPSKTEKYLDISNQQLKKLHQMVEKLLETATLDSDKLFVNKEPADIVFLLKQLVDKYRIIAPEKKLLFSTNVPELQHNIDVFHFENALANLVDNAIKYGGTQIEVNINSVLDRIEISIADNGVPIDPSQRDKIFEKFYRVPTGNRHDVKGFGIGLFYSKKIIEKHNGELELVPNKYHTIFKVIL